VLEYFWWGSVFLLGVPVMALLLAVGPWLLPEFRDPHAGRLDLPSAALSLCAVLAMIYGLKRVAESGALALALGAIVLGAALGVAFVRRQRRLADPLIDLGLFRARAFSAALVTYLIACFVGFGAYVFIAQYLQLVLGFSPLRAGLWTLPSMLSYVVAALIVPRLTSRVRPAPLMAGGLVVAAIGFATLALVDTEGGLALLVAGSVLYSLGLSPVVILATDLVVGSAPAERAGAAAAISETSAELGGALGIALLGSVLTAVYRRAVAGAVPPGVAHDSAETARATLGGAVATAESLPPALGAALLDPARDAFVRGLQLGVLACAVLVLVTAALTWRHLREARAAVALEAEPG
jgi:DHA2 family multidrug resistance protein-like MFS transporter